MNVLLFITQFLLSAVLVVSGYRRIAHHKSASGLFVSTKALGEPAAAFIGAFEWLLAILLVLPRLLGIHGWLTPISALSLACLMVGAAGLHVVCREYKRTAVPLVICALALFVVFGGA